MRTQFKIFAAIVITGFLACSACGTTDSDSETNNSDFILDLNTLEANTPEGTLHAEPVPDAYVGEVSDDLFIAVAAGAGEPKSVTAYLCNGEAGVWLNREISGETAILSKEELQVEADLSGSEITGTVTLTNGDSGSFTAVVATGNAGLYRAVKPLEGEDYTAGWIVLPDGRQRGYGVEEEEELLQM